MNENVLIALNDFKLPADFSWRVKFMDIVDDHLKRLGVTGHIRPPRFFGYYFEAGQPVVLTGKWTVRLSAAPLLTRMELAIERITAGEYRINSSHEGSEPDFILVHDRFDCACWLWRFDYGRRFIESAEPVFTGEGSSDLTELGGNGEQKLLGP